MRKKWTGTVLFAAILVVMGLTVGLKLYGSGLRSPAPALTTSTPQPTLPSQAPAASGSSAGPTTGSTPTATASTVSGAVEQTPYGPVQVSVTFVGRTITGVKELQAPSDRGRSVEINRYAEPILRDEVLKAQSAHVDTVSGATYTSEGYARSAQSAIDRL